MQNFSFVFSVCVSLRAFMPGVKQVFSENIGVTQLFINFLTGTCESHLSLSNRSLYLGPPSLQEAVNGVNR